MTLDLLIQAIVRQTTILIAQLATSAGARAPLAQIADQVFLDLVRELERQGVSRRVSADMFGLGLRTYQRKIQRLGESQTERGRSLWEAVLDYVRQQSMVTRAKVLTRFSSDDEFQVRSVLHDLSESRLIFSSGAGVGTIYRAATDDELHRLQQLRPEEGFDELIWAFVYRLGPLASDDLARDLGVPQGELEGALTRLVDAGRVTRSESDGRQIVRSHSLLIPQGASAGWEGAVFDHYKAVVNTIAARLNQDAAGQGRVGGSTYTLEVWEGHPLAEEVLETLSRLRQQLGAQREAVERYNQAHPAPENHTRVVHYIGQCLIGEGARDPGTSDDTT